MELTNEQKRFVDSDLTGIDVCLASAGTGKTTTIISKIVAMLDSGIDPRSILAVTFTKNAAKELKDRVLRKVINKDEAGLLNISTIHSFAYRLLGNYMFLDSVRIDDCVISTLSIIDECEKLSIVDRLAGKIYGKNNYDIMEILSSISLIKANGFVYPFSNCYYKNVELCREYTREVYKSGKIDFDDLLSIVYYLLITDPSFLTRISATYQYILVDEAQDLNSIQASILGILYTTLGKYIAYIGDIKQAIYGFRGASSKILMDISKFERSRRYSISQSFRLPSLIGEIANEILDSKVYGKTIGAAKRTGSATIVNSIDDVAKIIKDVCIDESYQHMILYRNNSQAYGIASKLDMLGVEYYCDSLFSEFGRHMKLVVLFARIFTEGKDVVLSYDDVVLIQNYYPRFVRHSDIKSLVMNGVNLDRIVEIATNDSIFGDSFSSKNSRIKSLFRLLCSFIDRDMTCISNESFIEYLLEVEAFYKMLISTKDESNIVSRELVLKELEEYTSIYEFIESRTAANSKIFKRKDLCNVHLTTIHRAKGMEADSVYLIGLDHGVFPDNRCDLSDELALLYVAVTRTKEHLYVADGTGRFSSIVNSLIRNSK